MRRFSNKIYCRDVAIGGGAPVSIQSMTNTDTRDWKRTLDQINALKDSGCQIIRCAIPNMEAAEAFGILRGKTDMPLVADIHFDYRLALEAIRQGADKIRINPGNIGGKDRVEQVVKAAKARGIPIRIGVNTGSLEKDLMEKYGGVTVDAVVESAMGKMRQIEEMDYDNIVVSIKSSNVKMNYDAHMKIANQMNYPLHIGITESGITQDGIIKSAIGIGSLLLAGIGDTLRVSLTGDPVKEIPVARSILRAAGLYQGGIDFISCPTCGRCKVNLPDIATEVEKKVLEAQVNLNIPPGKTLTVAVMGCEVNGPGEAAAANLGAACGKGKAVIFKDGKIIKTVDEPEIARSLVEELNRNWGRKNE